MEMKEKILDTARKLYNAQGIKNVTARVISNDLGISLGSFTYHFSDKNTIISFLYESMRIEINTIFASFKDENASITTYLRLHKELFLVQEKYKFFYLNLFEILINFEAIKEVYLNNLLKERELAKNMIQWYVEKGIIKANISEQSIERLINVGQILNNFWAIDAEIMPNRQNKLAHYMHLCCGILEPYLEDNALILFNDYFKKLENP